LKEKAKDWEMNPYSPVVPHSHMKLSPSLKPIIADYKEQLLREYKNEHPQYEYTFELLANSSHLTFWR